MIAWLEVHFAPRDLSLPICAMACLLVLGTINSSKAVTEIKYARPDQQINRSTSPTFEQSIGRREKNIACNNDKENRDSELCAEWKAADATAEATEISRLQLWIAGGGFLLGLITMFAAVGAALFARRAAIETGKGSGAAIQAVALTRESMERELRAYVSLDIERDGEWRIGEKPSVKIAIRNNGQTPAKNLTAAIRVKIAASNEIGTPKNSDNPARVVVGAGATIERPRAYKLALTESDLSDMIARRSSFVCRAAVNYEDIFGKEWYTKIAVIFDGPELELRYCRDGNDAT